jgi:hypothetical protein
MKNVNIVVTGPVDSIKKLDEIIGAHTPPVVKVTKESDLVYIIEIDGNTSLIEGLSLTIDLLSAGLHVYWGTYK